MTISTTDISRILTSTELFLGVHDESIKQIAEFGTVSNVEPGHMILKENEVGTQLYTILDGRVEVSIKDTTNNDIVVKTLKDGGVFGELALLGNRRRAASAKAIDLTTMISWESEVLIKHFENNPTVGYRIVKNLARDLASKLTSTNMSLRNASI